MVASSFTFKNIFVRIGLLLILCITNTTYGFDIKGKITNEKNEPLPYATIIVKGTTIGTIANFDGDYKLQLIAGKYILLYKYIGYKTFALSVDSLYEDKTINVKLEPEKYTLKEIVVSDGGEDPAMEIMRKAIANRKMYLDEVQSFACDAYIKGIQRMGDYPKKIMGRKVDFGGQLDSTTGIIYLSESVSQLNVRKPNDKKEIMISSKVSGRSRAFSFNRAAAMLINFYENNISIEGISQRGFVSPVAGNAMFYYKYKLLGSFIENEILVYKIEVQPKREHDPVFRGFIYVQDKSWRLQNIDLTLTKDAQIQFIDTLQIQQIMMPVNDTARQCMPVTSNFYFSYSFLGFNGNGNFQSSFSNYDIKPEFENNFFNGEVVKVIEGSNKKDDDYWNNTRPTPLTEIEQKDYAKRDSAEVIKNSKAYKDSLDKTDNKFNAIEFVYRGYSHRNRFYKRGYTINSLLEILDFNTVAGLNAGLSVNGYKNFEKRKKLSYEVQARYALSTKDLLGDVTLNYQFNRHRSAVVGLSFGHNYVQFNERNPISAFVNKWYSLLAERNYMKLYRKNYGEARMQYELYNGIFIDNALVVSQRSALVNNDKSKWIDRADIEFISNNPQNIRSDEPAFGKHNSIKNTFLLRLRLKQKYYSDPENFYVYGSKFPELKIKYVYNNVYDTKSAHLHFLSCMVSDNLSLRLLGKLQWQVEAGKFIDGRPKYFIDYHHFNGNKTLVSNFDLSDFQLLDYYTSSTNNQYLQAHIENNFGGFFFNKVPLLRKALLNEIIGIHYLYTPETGNSAEMSFGVEKIGLLRIAFCMRVFSPHNQAYGFRLGLLLNNRN
nr:carboxypeptidase-like regulatory domain-containing protein [Bacteroidota bacterium]